MLKFMNFERMKKMTAVLELLTVILFWCIVAMGALMLIASVVVALIPNDLLIIDISGIGKISQLKYVFEDTEIVQIADTLALKPIILTVLPMVLLNIVFYEVNLWQLKKVLGSVSKDRPFDTRNADSFYIMSIAFVVGGLLLDYIGTLAFANVISVLGIDIIGLVSYSVNFTMLFTGLMLFVLAAVFKYGNYLQEEYDDTV